MDILALNIESFAKQYATFTLIDTRATTTYNVAHLKDSINLATKDSISIFIQENFNLQDSNTTNNFNLSSPPPPLVSHSYFSAFQPKGQRILQSFL